MTVADAGVDHDMQKHRLPNIAFLIWCALVLSAAGARAQSPGPQPLPMPPQIAAPRDIPYPGAIRLSVDATDIERHIFNVHETIPVRGGESVVLLYPQWLPGNHSPTGQVDAVAGLMIYANGARVEWVRDPVDVFAFHVNVPAGATTLDVSFQFTSPVDANEGRVDDDAGYVEFAVERGRSFIPPAILRGRSWWSRACSCPKAGSSRPRWKPLQQNGGVTTFKPVPLNTLVDSPMFAGRYFKRLDLDPGGPAPGSSGHRGRPRRICWK